MREIKFRAWGHTWQTDELTMCEPFDFRKYVMYHEAAQEKLYPFVGEETVFMQYTGLKDKNSVEIYEGDILKAKHEDGLYDTGEVVYGSRGAFCLCLPKVATGIKTPLINYMNGIMFPESDFEVIGNIYENPELLNKS